MTNDQIKCPVCGEGMEYMGYIGDFLYGCTCGMKLCLEDIDNIYTLIQLRIDKEKAAAVQEERERKLSDLTDDERMEIFRQYCTSCGCADPKCQCWNDD